MFLCVCVCLRLRVYVRFLFYFFILVPDAYVSHHGGQPSELTVDHFVLGAEAAQTCIAPNLGYL